MGADLTPRRELRSSNQGVQEPGHLPKAVHQAEQVFGPLNNSTFHQFVLKRCSWMEPIGYCCSSPVDLEDEVPCMGRQNSRGYRDYNEWRVCVEVPKLKEFMLLKARKRGGLHLLLSWSCTPQVLWHHAHLPPFKGLRGVEAFFKVLTTLGSRDWKLEQKKPEVIISATASKTNPGSSFVVKKVFDAWMFEK